MATFASPVELGNQAGSSATIQSQNSPNLSSAQGNHFTAEDIFNYLYGYTPIRLVDPVQLHLRRKQALQMDSTAAHKPAFSCKYLTTKSLQFEKATNNKYSCRTSQF